MKEKNKNDIGYCKTNKGIVVFEKDGESKMEYPTLAEILGGGYSIRYYMDKIPENIVHKIEILALEEYKMFHKPRFFPQSDKDNIPVVYAYYDGSETNIRHDYWTLEQIDNGEIIQPNETKYKYLGLAKKIEYYSEEFNVSLIDCKNEEDYRFCIVYQNNEKKTVQTYYRCFTEALEEILTLPFDDKLPEKRLSYEYQIWINDWKLNNPVNLENLTELENKFVKDSTSYLKDKQKFLHLSEKDIEKFCSMGLIQIVL